MPRTWRLASTLLVVLSTGLLVSCDESTGNDGTVVITLNPAGVTVTQGTAAASNIVISREGGFNGVVSLAASGLPSGVFVTMTPSQLSSSTNNAVVDVSAALFSVPGSYSVTVTATGEGIDPARTTLQLTVMPAPDFRLAVSSPALAVVAGGSISTNINIDRTNFVGEIELGLLNAPDGITATFNPPSPTSNSSSMTINAAPGVTPASYPLVVQGLSALVGSRTANLSLDVLPQPGGFTITPTPGSFTIPRGNSTVVNIAIGRTDYSGPVTLTFENPPPGITGTIVPSNTTGTTATFTLNIGDAVSAGIYTLRVRATAPGFVDRISFITVTVTVPVGGTVEYLFCDPGTAPVFLAYQDGVGAWKPVTPTTNGGLTTYAFTLAQDRGGVLIVSRTTLPFVADALRFGRSQSSAQRAIRSRAVGRTPRAQQATVAPLVDIYHTELVYASTTELRQDGFDNCRRTQTTKTVTGNVNGVNTGEVGIISLGSATAVMFGGGVLTPITLSGVPEGTLDLVASRQLNAGNPPNRLVVMRGLQVDDGGTLPTVDFAAPSSLAPAVANATLSGGGVSDLFELFVDLVTDNSRGQLWFDLAPNSTTTRPWGGLATADRLTTDLHGLFAFATPISGVAGDFRVSGRYVGEVTDQALMFGPVMNSPAFQQVATGNYPRYRFSGTVPPEYNRGVELDLLPRNGPGNTYSIIASSAWLAGAGSSLTYDFTMPDVFGLAGFPAAARLTPGPNDSAVSGFGFNGQGIFDLRPALGMEFKAASRGFMVPVP
jgi:hypothetical protein